MVIMTLTRDFVHAAAMNFPPGSGAHIGAIFFTRWIALLRPRSCFAPGLGA
jgi:hypothetical protein